MKKAKLSEEEKKQRARENAKRYYKKNKEKVLAKQKEYVKKKYATDEKFRKKVNERNRKYVLNNQEKVREAKRKWASKHYKEMREKGLCKPTKNEIIENLQERIDKAIEYLEKSKLNQLDTYCKYLHINFSTEEIENIDELISILRGETNE